MASVAWTGYVSSSGAATNGGSSASVKQTGTSWSSSSTTVTSTNGTIGGTGVVVGDLVYLTSATNGYNSTWFRITSVTDSSHVVVHAAPDTTSGSGSTWNVGGPLTWAQMLVCAGQMAAAGYQETWYVKADGTYSRTSSSDAFTNAGVANAPIRIVGYKTSTSDGYLGRAANYGALSTTNCAYILYTTGKFAPNKAWLILENLFIQTAATAAAALTTAGLSYVINCSLLNTYNGASALALSMTTGDKAINCDITTSGATSSTAVYVPGTQYVAIYGCRINSTGYGVDLAGGSSGTSIMDTIIYGGTIGIYFASYNCSIMVSNCTIYGCSTAAFQHGAGGLGTGNSVFINNIISNCGIAWDSAYAGTNPDPLIRYNNRTRANTTLETTNAFLNWPTYLGVTADYGQSDFVNAGSGNFALTTGSPALNTAIPPGDIGAYEHPVKLMTTEKH